MDQLPSPQDNWDLKADKKLFYALQQFSASFLLRLKGAEASVASLAKDAEDTGVRAQCLQISFRQLANTHYIKQTVRDPEKTVPESLALPVSGQLEQLTPANFDQVVQPRYAEAIRLATQALERSQNREASSRPLPFMFGSPEYLQDPHGGLGPLIPGWRPPPPVAASASGLAPEWAEYSSAAASTVGEFDADEFSMAEGASDASGMQRLPDFKSMLEAALRGDVGDDGASTSHRTHKSSGSVDGHTGFRTGLEPISEGLFPDARNDGSCLEKSSAPQNAHVQDAIHASLDLSQQAQPSSREHAALREGSAFADPNFQESVSRALDAGMAEPAKPRPIPKGGSEQAPLSEELLSRHSASMDQLSEAQASNGLSSSHLQGSRRPKPDCGQADRDGKHVRSFPVAEAQPSGGLFDDDEAVEELMQGLREVETSR